MTHTGPLPKFPLVTASNVLKSTADERGLCHLLLVLERIGEAGDYEADDGWIRFDTGHAPLLAGEIICDLLSYLHRTGGLPAMRRAVGEAIDQFDPGLDLQSDDQTDETARDTVRLLHAASLAAMTEELTAALKQEAIQQQDQS
ncbi:hypothetical protein DVA86_27305 [Streptomyces armeniacus]|uniref:Uncharacterized protein n=1 Tax=Streptomyces armeniacus TaxID=83291 RepID=A0A345XVX2_9ACTN|nr:hypothetical protein [Streptomyces armeniacus]AXK35788.1 hypothetical protein DVA86_27305 [Streptomyces armeniacus]